MNAVITLFVVLVAVVCGGSCAPVALGTYNVDLSQSSVSGLSSGAYFAQQMHTAYSSTLRGVGIFAGGPYDCAQGKLNEALTTCMKATVSTPDINQSIKTTQTRASKGEIDDPSNLKDQKVFLFSGTKDTTVATAVVSSVQQYYQAFMPSANIFFEDSLAAGHTQPTNLTSNTERCSMTMSPYVSYCDYDGAGNALSFIYGSLNPPAASPSGTMIEFDQTAFIKGKSMATSGYIYVPTSCAKNELCTLHVAFHGCQQYYGTVGSAYIEGSGYNEWADTNNMIILYPQTTSSRSNPSNGNGCWNWWGYNNNPTSYDTQDGYQMAAVMAMMQHVSSGFAPIDSPSGLAVDSVTNTSVSLSWKGVSNSSSTLAGYAVQRNGATVSSTISGTSYVDSGLSTGTSYTYTVVAVTTSGSNSSPSNAVTATTSGPPPPLTAPTGLIVSDLTSSSLTLSWDALSGATKYQVTRDGSSIGTPSSPSITDSGLAEQTTYTYSVSGIDSTNQVGPAATITATTPSSFQCSEYTSSNYNHVAEGRAYTQAGLTYAVGSNDDMGLYNTFVSTTLAETSPDYYVVGTCSSV